jgi:hypothetical protein
VIVLESSSLYHQSVIQQNSREMVHGSGPKAISERQKRSQPAIVVPKAQEEPATAAHGWVE